MAVDGNFPSVRARDRNDPRAMRQARGTTMDPLPAAVNDGVTDAIHPEPPVVVAADGEHRRHAAERADHFAQPAQFRAMVNQVAPEQQRMRATASHGIENLPTQRRRSAVPEVKIADVQQPTGVVPRRQPLFADVQRSTPPDLQWTEACLERPWGARDRVQRTASPNEPGLGDGLAVDSTAISRLPPQEDEAIAAGVEPLFRRRPPGSEG